MIYMPITHLPRIKYTYTRNPYTERIKHTDRENRAQPKPLQVLPVDAAHGVDHLRLRRRGPGDPGVHRVQDGCTFCLHPLSALRRIKILFYSMKMT